MSPSAATTSGARQAAVKGNGVKPTSVHATSSDQAVQYENEFAAHNYHPLPIVMAKGEGVLVWDPEVSLPLLVEPEGAVQLLMSLLLHVRLGQRIPRLSERLFGGQPGSLSS